MPPSLAWRMIVMRCSASARYLLAVLAQALPLFVEVHGLFEGTLAHFQDADNFFQARHRLLESHRLILCVHHGA
jgi:hypothetical protein